MRVLRVSLLVSRDAASDLRAGEGRGVPPTHYRHRFFRGTDLGQDASDETQRTLFENAQSRRPGLGYVQGPAAVVEQGVSNTAPASDTGAGEKTTSPKPYDLTGFGAIDVTKP